MCHKCFSAHKLQKFETLNVYCTRSEPEGDKYAICLSPLFIIQFKAENNIFTLFLDCCISVKNEYLTLNQ